MPNPIILNDKLLSFIFFMGYVASKAPQNELSSLLIKVDAMMNAPYASQSAIVASIEGLFAEDSHRAAAE